MVRFPQSLLARSVEEGARRVALRLLEEAESALARVGEVADPEALHDFRVNLRRLRSGLLAFLPHLERRSAESALGQLRALARQTGSARDHEVQIEWLREREKSLRQAHRRAAAALIRDLEGRKRAAYARVLDGVPEAFGQLQHTLHPKLEAYRTWVRLDATAPSPNFAEVTSQLLRERAAALQSLLAIIRTPAEEDKAHQARLQAKRLRYLLEPSSPHVEGGMAALKHLKALQDLLGELNDLRLLQSNLGAALERAALARAQRLIAVVGRGDAEAERRARRADLENGILAVARLVEERRQRLFADLAAKWLGAQGAGLFAEFEAIAARLGRSASEHVEIERKFLLSGLPEAALRGDPAEVEQGWLPGSDIRERVRRVSYGLKVRFFRTVKLGSGIRRSEFEDEIGREVFEQLWPLTAGCRVRKRRYSVRAGDFVWEIDDFLDRELVLAEVELPSEETEVKPPEWLAPYIEREVTGDPRYLNLNLAC